MNLLTNKFVEVCSMFHWLDQESLFGVSVYGCLVALEIKSKLYRKHAFFQIDYFSLALSKLSIAVIVKNFL